MKDIAVSIAHQQTTNLTLLSALSVFPWGKLRGKITLDHLPPGVLLLGETVPFRKYLNF